MPLLSLPTETFINVLVFLDDKSLYRCLLVNRHWCRLSIPILWEEPLECTYMNNIKHGVINTLLSCLNEDETSSLIPCGIIFSNKQSPLFEYGKFIRKISQRSVKNNILTWLDWSSDKLIYNRPHNDCRVQRLVNAIYHMIMRQGSNLQEFDLRVFKRVFYDLPKASIFTTYNPGISNLGTLNIKFDFNFNEIYHNTLEFLSMISTSCNSIIKCNLLLYNLNSNFIKLFLDIIKLQPLERMLMYFDNIEAITIKENAKNLINALEFRSETLKELTFECLDFQGIDLVFISKLVSLDKLIFIHCKGFASQKYEALSEKKLQLKELSIWHKILYNISESYGIKTMINSICNSSLQNLYLNITTLETINAVKESCPSIGFLHIKISIPSDLIIPSICELLSLRILIIEIGHYDVDTGLLVKLLGDFLKSVECLLLQFHVDILSFKYFTENCKANLRKCITLNEIFYVEKYLICVDNYQRIHNSLKVFGIIEKDEFNSEELKIIASLNSQGIDIITSSNVYQVYPIEIRYIAD